MRAPWKVFCLVALLGCPGKNAPNQAPADETAVTPATAMSPSREPLVGAPVAAGPLRNPVVGAPYAIVVPKGSDAKAVRARVEAALAARGYALDVADPKPSDRHGGVEIAAPVDANFHISTIEYFGHGLAEADAKGLAAATEAVMFATIGPSDVLAQVQHDGAAIAHEVATQGWIVDSATGEVFTRAAFAEARPAGFPIDVRTLMVVHAVREAEGPLVFLETFGLERLGVPELYMGKIPHAFADEMLELVNAAAQSLVERGSMTADGELAVDLSSLTTAQWNEFAAGVRENGGSGKVTFRAAWSMGDGDNMLVELTLPSGAAAEEMHAAVTAFLGNTLNPSVAAPEGDAELLAASARAKKQLAAIAKRCVKGIPELETLTVKAPFETSEGVEFMWVEVQACKGDTFRGVLLNQPNGESPLKPGSSVEVKLDDAFDYKYTHADKTEEGDETTKIILQRQGRR